MYFLSPVVLFLNYFRRSLHLSPFLCLSIFPSLFLSKPLSLPSPSFIPVYLICPPSVFTQITSVTVIASLLFIIAQSGKTSDLFKVTSYIGPGLSFAFLVAALCAVLHE